MPEDFDINGLAAYLHLMPTDVSRLADRGKLPGRRVGGVWRFARAEIHHWLEDRIGLSDDAELVRVEDALHRASDDDQVVRVAPLISVDAIAVPLNARTRPKVIDQMCELAASTGMLWDPEKMADAVRQREAMHSTALDSGVALLHPRRPMSSILADPLIALGKTTQGIPFGGAGGLTDLFFLICSVSDEQHLRVLARLSRMLTADGMLACLRAAESADQALQCIEAYESELGG